MEDRVFIIVVQAYGLAVVEWEFVRIIQLAPGVLVTMDSDREFCVYFDAERVRIDPEVDEDTIAINNVPGFAQVRFLDGSRIVQSWEQMFSIAKSLLVALDDEIEWFEQTLEVDVEPLTKSFTRMPETES